MTPREQELEEQLAAASRMHDAALVVMREVLAGAGASLDEALRASVAMGHVTRILKTQAQPQEPQEQPIKGRIINLGMRRRSFYEAVFDKPEEKP